MSVNVVMPQMGESVSSGTVGAWIKQTGEMVQKDEPIVSIETDKANVDVPAPVAGRLGTVRFKVGAEVKVGEILVDIDPAGAGAAPEAVKAANPAVAPVPVVGATPAPTPAQASAPVIAKAAPTTMSPAVAYHVEKNNLDPSQLQGTGPGGRVLKGDVLDALSTRAPEPAPAPKAPAIAPPPMNFPAGDRSEVVEPMTPVRKTIARRLVEAQSNAAILTTFNEVDMSRIMQLREEYQDAFTKKHGIKLGFMSFFVKAAVEALKAFPLLNSEIRGTDIIKKNYYDIGVAVGGGKGLVVPIIRNAEKLSFAQIEKVIADFGARAKDGKIKLEEMQGGTFSITNGGIYGSMLSTPILNPPQSGILGMHNIQKRAVVVNDQVVVRPMMYLALSYDHRIVDGREAVSSLVKMKESLEKPERLLFEI